MSTRRSVYVDGLHHGDNPTPAASRVGPLVVSGNIAGQDPATGEPPGDPDDELAFAFANVARVMVAAGGSTDDIARLAIHITDPALRARVNEHWVAMFPDAGSRPARQVKVGDLPFGFSVQIELIAYVSEDDS